MSCPQSPPRGAKSLYRYKNQAASLYPFTKIGVKLKEEVKGEEEDKSEGDTKSEEKKEENLEKV